MASLSLAAMMTIAAVCRPPPPLDIDPHLLMKIVPNEGGFRTDAVHVNRDGSRDLGPWQINSSNFAWLGVDARSLLDETPIVRHGQIVPRGACLGAQAAVKVLTSLSAYNTGSPTRGLGYAMRVATTEVAEVKAAGPLGIGAMSGTATISAVERPAVYARPARARRELVISSKE